ncbi:MAG: EscU/YscU/HrcU family type III secretion system export apparatus switch protein [Deltaproteobacteria bacterium]|nr:MAG: EscU/YscU/HrcU family type III secretion system export apparatus switch protein [Deltaproteobacteria bacterium]
MAEQAQERQHPATPKRIREALERGENPRSREVAAVAVMMAGLVGIVSIGSSGAAELKRLVREGLTTLERPDPVGALVAGVTQAAALVSVPFVLMVLAAVAANLAQGKLAFAVKAIEPRWDKIDPVARFKQLFFSRRSVVELVKAVGKVSVIGAVCWFFIHEELESVHALTRSGPGTIVASISRAMMKLALAGGTGLAALALADALYSRWDWHKRLMMTSKELRDDLKEQDGDPLVRSRRRQKHRELSINRVLAEVPRADVVVTNPVHFAVALKYEPEKWSAPRVVAKGADELAMKIRSIARASGVPVVENRPLARALYKTVKVGQLIDESFYKAVAEIYAFLHRLRSGNR